MSRSFNSVRRTLWQLRTDPFLPLVMSVYLPSLMIGLLTADVIWLCVALLWGFAIYLAAVPRLQKGRPAWLARQLTPYFFSVKLISGRWGVYQRRLARRKRPGSPQECRDILKGLIDDQVRLPASLVPGRYQALTHDTVIKRLKRLPNIRSLEITPSYMSDMASIRNAMTGKRCKKCKWDCPFPLKQEQLRQFYIVTFEIQ